MAVADLALVPPDVSPRAAQPPAEKKPWLSPEFAHQVLRTAIGALVAILAAWFILKGDVAKLSEAVARIETNMPNAEVLNFRLEAMESKLSEAKAESEQRRSETRELLAYVIALRMAVEKRGIDTDEPPKIE